MEVINYDNIKEQLIHETMDNGLEVYLIKKEGFSKTYGLFSTRFGSVDTSFVPFGQKEMVRVPDGIAHFLEHKMFDTKKGDAAELFAKLGASTNAFTSSCRTCYLFNTVENVEACTMLLLDFVQELCVSDASIEKEKGIINQEIGMYDDDPDWNIYFSSIQNLYHNHPVKVDIAGTVETVSTIYKDDLEKCYNTFYHPSNMMLVVVGNIEVDTLMEAIKKNQNHKSFTKQNPIVLKKYDEPTSVYQKEKEITMEISMEQVILSIKINEILDHPKDKLKRELACNMLLDLLFCKSSKIIEQWEKEGIINDSFGGTYTSERDYAFIQIGGESNHIDILEKRMIDLLYNLSPEMLDEESFLRAKKNNYGSMITLLNSPENIGNIFTKYFHEGIIFFDIYEAIKNIKIEDLYDVISLFKSQNYSITKLKKLVENEN